MPKHRQPDSLRTKYSAIAGFFNLADVTVKNWHKEGILATRIVKHILWTELDGLEQLERKSKQKLYPAYGKKI